MKTFFWNIGQRFLHKLAMIAPGGYSMRPKLHRLRGATIGSKVWISQYVYLDEIHPESVSIGNNSSIGIRTSIIAHLYWGPRKDANPAGNVIIEDDVFIGPHCVILPGVRIGKGAVVPAGTVVSRNVPAHALWSTPKCRPLARVGVPLTADHSYDEFSEGLTPWSLKK
jgi:acetyltransferase-like isoleucine patch superfamily enzyme